MSDVFWSTLIRVLCALSWESFSEIQFQPIQSMYIYIFKNIGEYTVDWYKLAPKRAYVLNFILCIEIVNQIRNFRFSFRRQLGADIQRTTEKNETGKAN